MNKIERGMGVTKSPKGQKIPARALGGEAERPSSKWQIRGFTDARVFIHPDRATLTFFYKGTVASIHFDLTRREIFFKGHNVKNRKLTQEEWQWLKEFGQCLRDYDAELPLREAYEKSLAELFPEA